MTRLLLVAGLCAAMLVVGSSACSTMPSGPRETCGNGVDDDNNGLIDCADPDCKGKSECFFDGGFYGTCSKCGQVCARQEQCLQTSFFNDVPLPTCESADGGAERRCTAFARNRSVDVVLNAQNAWGTNIAVTRSIATRFIKRTGTDGGMVNCSTVEAAAPGRLATDARQLEDTGAFNYLGIDVRVINNASANIPLRLLNVITGGDYFIWMEMWGGPPDGITKFPTGRRLGFECFDGPSIGQQWAPITDADNCVAAGVDGGAGTACRIFNVTAIRGPQP